MKEGSTPSGRSLEEVLRSMTESFIRKNGYIPNEDDAIRLTEEAREELRQEKDKA